MERNLITLFEICVLLNTLCLALRLNDECTITYSNEKGICQFINDCPTVVKEVTVRSISPTLCGFQSGRDIVCCSNKTVSSSKDRLSYKSLYSSNIIDEKMPFTFQFFFFQNVWNIKHFVLPKLKHILQIVMMRHQRNSRTW